MSVHADAIMGGGGGSDDDDAEQQPAKKARKSSGDGSASSSRPKPKPKPRAKSRGSSEGGDDGAKKELRGFAKPKRISEELAAVTGQPEMSRGTLMKWLYAYAKEKDLYVSAADLCACTTVRVNCCGQSLWGCVIRADPLSSCALLGWCICNKAYAYCICCAYCKQFRTEALSVTRGQPLRPVCVCMCVCRTRRTSATSSLMTRCRS
jgi:hypothetical protein